MATTTAAAVASSVRAGRGAYDLALAAFVALAAWSTYGAPTVGGAAEGVGIWTLAPLPTGGAVLAGLAVLTAALVLSALQREARASSLDVTVAWLVGGIALLHLLAAARGVEGRLYEPLDIRAVLLLAGGYLVVSRCGLGRRELSWAVLATAGLLALHAAWLVVRHGILGDTGFATTSGRIALLVTEDTLLLAIPVCVAWGAVIDGLVRRWVAAAIVAFLAAVLLVELLSLRRGALIFIGALLLARSAWAPPQRLVAGATAAVVVVLALVAAGPLREVADDASYAVRSSLLLTEDASSQQRRVEFEAYAANVGGAADVALGRGLGAIWTSSPRAPIDAVAYGGEETALVRVGWHVYGLDWLYKLGIAGLLLGMAATAAVLLTARARAALVDDRLARAVIRSLALVTPVLLLFVFTNARLALFAGLTAGALSALLDERPA